jgi:hypothetical protein
MTHVSWKNFHYVVQAQSASQNHGDHRMDRLGRAVRFLGVEKILAVKVGFREPARVAGHCYCMADATVVVDLRARSSLLALLGSKHSALRC